jgi:hypothetical protein
MRTLRFGGALFGVALLVGACATKVANRPGVAHRVGSAVTTPKPGELGPEQGYLAATLRPVTEQGAVFVQWVRSGNALTGQVQWALGYYVHSYAAATFCRFAVQVWTYSLAGVVGNNDQVSITLQAQSPNAVTENGPSPFTVEGTLNDSVLIVDISEAQANTPSPANNPLDPGGAPGNQRFNVETTATFDNILNKMNAIDATQGTTPYSDSPGSIDGC